MRENISSIIESFPDFETKIKWLYENDSSFQDVCTDYLLCTSKLAEFRKGDNKFDKMIFEYEELQNDLEQEMLHMIKSSKPLPER